METKESRNDSSILVAQLNARIQPMHRVEFFEDPLDARMSSISFGEIIGGGTAQMKSGEIEYCDIEVEVSSRPGPASVELISMLEELGAPRGSKLHIGSENRAIDFGVHEGIAIYLNT